MAVFRVVVAGRYPVPCRLCVDWDDSTDPFANSGWSVPCVSIQLTLSQIAEVVRVRENRSELTFYPKLSTVSIYPNFDSAAYTECMHIFSCLALWLMRPL